MGMSMDFNDIKHESVIPLPSSFSSTSSHPFTLTFSFFTTSPSLTVYSTVIIIPNLQSFSSPYYSYSFSSCSSIYITSKLLPPIWFFPHSKNGLFHKDVCVGNNSAIEFTYNMGSKDIRGEAVVEERYYCNNISVSAKRTHEALSEKSMLHKHPNQNGVTDGGTSCNRVVGRRWVECAREKAQCGGVMMVEAGETRQRRRKKVEE